MEPVSVRGQVPNVGDQVFIRAYGPKIEKEHDYVLQYAWKVKQVTYSITTHGSAKDRLLYDNFYSAEVKLEAVEQQ